MDDDDHRTPGSAQGVGAILTHKELDAAGVEWACPRPGLFVVTLPGTRKLSTTCSLSVGRHAITINVAEVIARHRCRSGTLGGSGAVT